MDGQAPLLDLSSGLNASRSSSPISLPSQLAMVMMMMIIVMMMLVVLMIFMIMIDFGKSDLDIAEDGRETLEIKDFEGA